MVKRLSVIGEPGSAIRHYTFALRGTNGHTEVGLARFAQQTFTTFRSVC